MVIQCIGKSDAMELIRSLREWVDKADAGSAQQMIDLRWQLSQIHNWLSVLPEHVTCEPPAFSLLASPVEYLPRRRPQPTTYGGQNNGREAT